MRTSKSRLSDLKRLRQMAPSRRSATVRTRVTTPQPGSPDMGSVTGRTPTDPSSVKRSIRSTPTLLSADDRELFRRAMKTVEPIKGSGRALVRTRPGVTGDVLRQRRLAATGLESASLPAISDLYSSSSLSHDDSRHLQVGYGPDLIKGIKRGKWPVEASIDLHGASLEEARLRLDQFLAACIEHHIKSVRVVHGKGHGSKNGRPVLKKTVRRWLTQLKHVMAYVECDERDGGSGALHVLLSIDR